MITEQHLEHLRSEGFTDEQIEILEKQWGVRSLTHVEAMTMGFKVKGEDGKYQSSSGLYFPFTGDFGQIRCDTPLERSTGRAAKYLTQIGKASQFFEPRFKLPQFHSLGMRAAGVEALTEGYKDAAAGTLHGRVITGALAGVSHYRKAFPEGSTEYKTVQGKVIIFDADGWTNPSVFCNLVNAGEYLKGKIQLLPQIPNEPKAGLCEYFKAGYTSDDYGSLIDNAYKPRDLILELPKHWKGLPTPQLLKCAKGAIALAAKYLGDLEQRTLLKAIAHACKLTIRDLTNELDRVKGILNRKKKKEIVKAGTAGEKLSFYQEVLKNLYQQECDHWICVEGKLYQWRGSFYELVPEEREVRRIYRYCNSYKVLNDEGLYEYPYASPAFIGRSLAWVKAAFSIAPDLINPPGLNCTNGVLHLRWEGSTPSWELCPHQPTDYYIYEPHVEYDPNANTHWCDMLLSCLDKPQLEIFLRNIAASLDLKRIRRFKGRTIRALFLKGEGSNGKDTLREVVSMMYGHDGMTSCTLGDFSIYDQGRKFALYKLRHSRISWSSENHSNFAIDRTQSLKAVITGDKISFEGKGINEEVAEPSTILLFNCNEAPNFTGALEAVKSRFAVLSFEKVFKQGADPRRGEIEADPRFKYDSGFLRTQVLPAFLNYVLQALKNLMNEGIDYAATNEAIESIKSECNHLYRFCEDTNLEYTPGDRVYVGEIWSKLEEWYVADGTLEIDGATGKRTWHDQAKSRDKNIKACNQVLPRLLELFPKARKGGKDNRGLWIENLSFVYKDPTKKVSQGDSGQAIAPTENAPQNVTVDPKQGEKNPKNFSENFQPENSLIASNVDDEQITASLTGSDCITTASLSVTPYTKSDAVENRVTKNGFGVNVPLDEVESGSGSKLTDSYASGFPTTNTDGDKWEDLDD